MRAFTKSKWTYVVVSGFPLPFVDALEFAAIAAADDDNIVFPLLKDLDRLIQPIAALKDVEVM